MTPMLLTTRPSQPAAPAVYEPTPTLPGRGPEESAEAYGLRALLFITAERFTHTVDDEGLQLAAHVFRLAVANPELTPKAAERLADVQRQIGRAIAQRAELAAQAQAEAAPAEAASQDRPNLGPMAPLTPPPTRPTPPAQAQRQPVTVGAPAAPVQAPAAPRAAFVPPVRPVLRPSAPVAVPAADWGF